MDWVAAMVGVVGGGAFGSIVTWGLSLKFIPAATKKQLDLDRAKAQTDAERWEHERTRQTREREAGVIKDAIDLLIQAQENASASDEYLANDDDARQLLLALAKVENELRVIDVANATKAEFVGVVVGYERYVRDLEEVYKTPQHEWNDDNTGVRVQVFERIYAMHRLLTEELKRRSA